MNISEVWKLYNESEKRVPEFDTALKGLANELGVSQEKAFEVFIQIIGAPEMSSAVRASVSFPLIKMANDAADAAQKKAARLLRLIEDTNLPATGDATRAAAEEAIGAAEKALKEMLKSEDVADKQGLWKAMTEHREVHGPNATVLRKLNETQSEMLALLGKKFDDIGGVYRAGDWIASPTTTTAERMLQSAAGGDKVALKDFIEMSEKSKGRELLGTVDAKAYERWLTDIARHTKIDTKDLLQTQRNYARHLSEIAAKRADPKRIYNILSDIFGTTGRPAGQRAAAVGRAFGFVKDLAVHNPRLTIALGLGAAGAYIVNKMTDFFGGGDKAKPGPASTGTDGKSSEEDKPAGSTSMDSVSASPGAAPEGDIADRVRARLKQVYSGGKK